MSPAFVRNIFLVVRKEGFKGRKGVNGTQDADVDMEGSGMAKEDEDEWFAMSAQAFGGKNTWTVIQFAGRQTLVWEMES
jgi:ribonuclease P/MRP protein subunit RPP40